MKARAEVLREAVDADPPQVVRFWGMTLIAASLGAWTLIIAAARFVAGL